MPDGKQKAQHLLYRFLVELPEPLVPTDTVQALLAAKGAPDRSYQLMLPIISREISPPRSDSATELAPPPSLFGPDTRSTATAPQRVRGVRLNVCYNCGKSRKASACCRLRRCCSPGERREQPAGAPYVTESHNVLCWRRSDALFLLFSALHHVCVALT